MKRGAGGIKTAREGGWGKGDDALPQAGDGRFHATAVGDAAGAGGGADALVHGGVFAGGLGGVFRR